MDGWKQMVVPESYVHPAKMAPLLCQKIFEHLEELKMIDPDSLVCDFMAGTGTTNIVASLRGYQSVSIELERKFIGIEAANRERLRQYIGKEPRWRIMQGDSRKLSKMLDGGSIASVMSPSYGGSEQTDRRWKTGAIKDNSMMKNATMKHISGFSPLTSRQNVGNLKTAIISPPYRNRFDQGNEEQRKRGNTLQSEMNLGGYSSNPSNVGNLKAGVVSPPYHDAISHAATNSKVYQEKRLWSGGGGEYSKSKKNIGNLKAGVVSPPYQDAVNSPKSDNRAERLRISGRDPKSYMGGTGRQLDSDIKYGKAKGQIGSLSGVTSPPYFGAEIDGGGKWFDAHRPKDRKPPGMADFSTTKKQNHPENIASNPETYESAMLQIYREAHRAGISPLVTVTKNPTRQGKLVRLDLITIDLLQKAGYSIFDYHQAILFKSHDVSSVNLDGIVDRKVHHKGRIGFFKKLSLNKGSVAASWEDVVFSR
jgi:hypothetical protein